MWHECRLEHQEAAAAKPQLPSISGVEEEGEKGGQARPCMSVVKLAAKQP